MSISSRIAEMEEHVHNAYDKIEDLGIDTTNTNKNINNISSILETVWNEQPKILGQGTDIVLKNTRKGKMKLDTNGRTEQEQLSGKNLFDGTYSAKGKYLNANGEEGSQSNFNISNFIEVKSNTPYTLSANLETGTLGGVASICEYDGEDNFVKGTIYNQDMTKTIITQSDTKKIKFSYRNDVTNYQLEEGSTATSYEPYCGGIPSPNPGYPQQIKNVTGNANVKIQNKNLFDKNNFEYVNGKRLDDNGNVVSDANSSYSLTLISVKPNTTYTIQGTQSEGTKTTRIYYYNNQKQFISRTRPFGTDSYSFTTLENCNYIGLQLRNSEYINVNIIQLEEGSTATSYVPHQEQNYPFTFAEGQRGMKGTTLEGDGIHNIRKQKVLLNPPATNADNSTIISVYWIVNNFAPNFNLDTFKKCTHFSEIKKWDASLISQGKTCLWAHDGVTFGIIFNKEETGVTTLAEARTYLVEHNIIVEWELAEEEIIPYNETQQAQYNNIKANASSYDDITIISSESDELGFDMNVAGLEKSVEQMLGGVY